MDQQVVWVGHTSCRFKHKNDGHTIVPDKPSRSDHDRLTVSVQESLEREERPTGSEADQYIEGT